MSNRQVILAEDAVLSMTPAQDQWAAKCIKSIAQRSNVLSYPDVKVYEGPANYYILKPSREMRAITDVGECRVVFEVTDDTIVIHIADQRDNVYSAMKDIFYKRQKHIRPRR